MSELLGMSFDAATSPTVRVRRGDLDPTLTASGWGFAWYPAGDAGAAIVKDPEPSAIALLGAVLRDWQRFRSTLFVCHVRGAGKRSGHENTHPFSRAHAGLDFVFAHSGQLDPAAARALPLGDMPAYEPVGRTDSERAFCWLLTQMRDAGARRLADIGWARLDGWFKQLNAIGTFSVLLSDGTDLVAHRDAKGLSNLYVARRTPPHAAMQLKNRIFEVDLTDPLDANRTMVLVATSPASKAGWRAMEPGELLVARHGAITWQALTSITLQSPSLDGTAEREIKPWSETGIQQAAGNAIGSDVASEPATTLPDTAKRADAQASPNPVPAPPVPQQPTVVQPSTGPARTTPSTPSTAPPVSDGTTRVVRIVHETIYRYEDAVERSSHLFRLRPVHDTRQHVLEHELTITPLGGERADFEDVFGNIATRLELQTAYTEMKLTATSKVRVSVDPPVQFPARRTSIPLVWMPWQRQMMQAYLLPLELPEPQLRELSDFAMSFAERQDQDLLETLNDINHTIRNDFAYVSKSTTLETTPFEVYTSRRGVCQDFANLFICLARLLGVPARYRVGYIRPSLDTNNPEQAAESHAWVEVYVPWTGWRGYDPTNGCLAGLDHVRVAVGRNYRDATPTSGTIYKGGRNETLSVSVRMEILEG